MKSRKRQEKDSLKPGSTCENWQQWVQGCVILILYLPSRMFRLWIKTNKISKLQKKKNWDSWKFIKIWKSITMFCSFRNIIEKFSMIISWQNWSWNEYPDCVNLFTINAMDWRIEKQKKIISSQSIKWKWSFGMQEKPCHFGNFFVICMKGRNMYSATSRDQISRKMMAKHAFSTAAAVIYTTYRSVHR